MEVQWLGTDRIRLTSRSTQLVIASSMDPEEAAALGVDLLLFDAPLAPEGREQLSTSAFIIDSPGEYEVHGAFVIGVQASQGSKGEDSEPCQVLCVEIDGITVCHLGRLGHKLTRDQVEALGEVQVLAVPMQGLSPALAAEVVAQIDPALVVPLGPSAGDEAPTGVVAKFLEEMAADASAPEARLIVDRARLPEEPTVVRLLPAD